MNDDETHSKAATSFFFMCVRVCLHVCTMLDVLLNYYTFFPKQWNTFVLQNVNLSATHVLLQVIVVKIIN